MMLIADSGATKTDWRFIDELHQVHSFSSAGLNPLFWKSSDMAREILKKTPKKIVRKLRNHPFPVYFYGASCSSPERNKIVYDALRRVFPACKPDIRHDILGSARALLGKNAGIACILGTGSNSCYYDGKSIQETRGGLTYILGDEGSGAHMGKELLKAFLNDELPEKIRRSFLRTYRLNKDKIFDAVYHQPHPNRFLASFAKFIHRHMDDPFIRKLVRQCLSAFFDKTICRYKNYRKLPVGFVGSIAAHFEPVLRKIAGEKSVRIAKIISNPADELVKYHFQVSIRTSR